MAGARRADIEGATAAMRAKLGGGAGGAPRGAAALSACVRLGVDFVDDEFPPDDSSLGKPDGSLRWMRPEEFAPDSRIELFTADEGKEEAAIEPNDVDQHGLGDCWFLASIAGIAEFPYLVLSIFDGPYEQSGADGEQLSLADRKRDLERAGARLLINKHGWWETVVVDTFIPCAAVGEKWVPAFVYNVEQPGEIWAAVIEKAYAKLHGSFDSLEAGSPADAFPDLTGFPAENVPWQRWEVGMRVRAKVSVSMLRLDKGMLGTVKNRETAENPRWAVMVDGHDEWGPFDVDKFEPVDDAAYGGELFKEMESYDENNFIMSLTTPSAEGKTDKDDMHGLSYGHAYTLVTVKQVGAFRLCKVRNPWGNEVEWTGAWSDQGAEWGQHPDVKRECGHNDEEDAPDGTFWMEWGDVRRYFDSAQVCYARPSWKEVRVRSGFDGRAPRCATLLRLAAESWVYITVSQRDLRDERPLPDRPSLGRYEHVVVAVASCPESTGKWECPPTQQSRRGVYLAARDVTLRVQLQPGLHAVVPRRFAQSGSVDCVFGFFVEESAGSDLTFIKPPAPLMGAFRANAKFQWPSTLDLDPARAETFSELSPDVQVNTRPCGAQPRVELSQHKLLECRLRYCASAGGRRADRVKDLTPEQLQKLAEKRAANSQKRKQAHEEARRAEEAAAAAARAPKRPARIDPFVPISEQAPRTDPVYLETVERVRAELLHFKREFYAKRGATVPSVDGQYAIGYGKVAAPTPTAAEGGAAQPGGAGGGGAPQ